MKHFLIASLVFLFACAHPENKTSLNHAPVYDTSAQISVFYVTGQNPIRFKGSPAKRITRNYTVADGLDSTTHPGEYIVQMKPVVDSVYLIATTDSAKILMDSVGKHILDSTGRTQFVTDWKKPEIIPRGLVQETNIISFPNIQ